MHPAQVNFVTNLKNKFHEHFKSKKVLEVGSLDINGSIRDLFTECDYLGIDVGEGKGVDRVISGHQMDAPDNHFDVTLSCECFEHNKYWKETFDNMYRMTKIDGLLFFTCATIDRPEHGTHNRSHFDSPYTLDYYKNLSIIDFTDFWDFDKSFMQYGFEVQKGIVNDLYFWGMKK